MSFIVHPSKWEAEHAGAIFAGQSYQSTHDGQLPDTPMWRMLEFRHSLNSARFDHWHPNVGLILEHREPGLESANLSGPHGWIGHMRGPGWHHEGVVPEQLANTIPPSEVSPPLSSLTAPPPTTTATQSVPEPSAVFQGLTAIALTVAFVLKRRRGRRGV